MVRADREKPYRLGYDYCNLYFKSRFSLIVDYDRLNITL